MSQINNVVLGPAPSTNVTSPVMQGAVVGRRTAVLCSITFLLLLAIPAGMQLVIGSRPPLWPALVDDYRNLGLQKTLNRVETHLIFDSAFSRAVRAPYQALLLRALRQGSSRVLVGADQYLFFEDDYDFSVYPGRLAPEINSPQAPAEPGPDAFESWLQQGFRRLVGRSENPRRPPPLPPPADPITVLSDFRDKLRQRNIHLLIVIVPAKTSMYPEKLWSGYPSDAGPAVPDGYAEWKRRLATRELDVLDLTEPFWQGREEGGDPLFLKLDSHWSPRGVARAADLICARLRPHLGTYRPIPFQGRPVMLTKAPDMVELLEVTPAAANLPMLSLHLTQLWQGEQIAPPAGAGAPVLLFGDSMTEYYEWEGKPPHRLRAGLGSQLSLRLGAEVEIVARAGGGRHLIQETLDTRSGILASRKVVVWELVARSLLNQKLYSLINIR
jgi:hypothetical protein